MSALFLKILNLSINTSWLILAVVAARLLLKKAPRWISCLLWGLVAVRLLCPISLESVLSILPSAKVVPDNIEMVQDPHIDSGVRIIDNAVNPVIEKSFSPNAASSVNPMQVVVFMGSIIWLTGMTVMLLYALISYILLRRKVRASVAMNDRVKECDEVDSPFILGIFRPEIYVPSGIDENTLELVIAHEEAHLKRHDHWWKPFGFVLLAVYWFNPLCWVAYILLCRDIEAACDEKVIKDKDREYMAAYSQALLDCSVNRRIIAACPLAFGETGVKERVKGVLNYKKPAFWVIIVAIVACIVVAVCFMTNPAKRITLPDDPVVFSIHDNPDGYIEYHWEEKGLVYVPYMPLDPGLAGDCIGYDELEGEFESYVCKVEGLSETEWICDVSSETVNGHTAGMIMREINVKKVPEGWESEYKWNIPYTDYVGDAPTVTEIARRLPYPEEYQYDHIEIQSGEEPYGLTVFLKGKPSVDVTQFQTAANKAFESIGNLGSITFSVVDSEETVTFLAAEDIITDDIGSGTTSNESVTDWMDITLPSGYSISSFRDDIGWQGGALILPRSYDIAAGFDSAPSEWIYSGLISRMPADNTGVTYKNGIPDLSGIPMNNHTDAEYIKVIGLERSNMQWPAIMLKESHDLYTASDMSRLSASGIDTEAMDLTSDYWSFWFVKEGEDTYYLLTLSVKEFTQEEAEEIASTVSIK